MNKTEFLITVIAALLSFIGALLGVYLGSHLEQSNWESRFQLEQKKTIVERRVSVMERVASSFNKAPFVAGLRATVKYEQASASLVATCVKLSLKSKTTTPACKDAKNMDTTHIESIAKEIVSVNTDLNTSLMLAAVYFGPETKAAIKGLGADPWVAESSAYQHLMDAMGKELNYFP